MAVIVPTSYAKILAGELGIASGMYVRQAHAKTITEGLNRLRATMQSSPFSWHGEFTTTSTSYQTIAVGLWYAPYNARGAGSSLDLTRIIHADNADVRVTLAAVGGGSSSNTVASLASTGIDVTEIGAGALATPATVYQVTIEAKVPATGTATVWDVALACVDHTGGTLY